MLFWRLGTVKLLVEVPSRLFVQVFWHQSADGLKRRISRLTGTMSPGIDVGQQQPEVGFARYVEEGCMVAWREGANLRVALARRVCLGRNAWVGGV